MWGICPNCGALLGPGEIRFDRFFPCANCGCELYHSQLRLWVQRGVCLLVGASILAYLGVPSWLLLPTAVLAGLGLTLLAAQAYAAWPPRLELASKAFCPRCPLCEGSVPVFGIDWSAEFDCPACGGKVRVASRWRAWQTGVGLAIGCIIAYGSGAVAFRFVFIAAVNAFGVGFLSVATFPGLLKPLLDPVVEGLISGAAAGGTIVDRGHSTDRDGNQSG